MVVGILDFLMRPQAGVNGEGGGGVEKKGRREECQCYIKEPGYCHCAHQFPGYNQIMSTVNTVTNQYLMCAFSHG